MSQQDMDWDTATGTLAFRSRVSGITPVEPAQLSVLREAARTGTWLEKPVRRVVVRFADAEAAQYNADALAFLRIETEGPAGLVKSVAFGTRSDFGIR
jgi:hypothetical protein